MDGESGKAPQMDGESRGGTLVGWGVRRGVLDGEPGGGAPDGWKEPQMDWESRGGALDEESKGGPQVDGESRGGALDGWGVWEGTPDGWSV